MTIHNKWCQIKSLPLQSCNWDVDVGPVLQGYWQREEKQNTERWITLINSHCLFSLKKYQCVLRCAPFFLLFTWFPFPSMAPLLITRGDQSLLTRRMFQVMWECHVLHNLCQPELEPAPYIHNLSSSRPPSARQHKPGPPVSHMCWGPCVCMWCHITHLR